MASDDRQPQKSLKRNRSNGDANRAKSKKKNKNDKAKDTIKSNKDQNRSNGGAQIQLRQSSSSAEQLNFFLQQFQFANGIKLSSLELESIKGYFFLSFSFILFYILSSCFLYLLLLAGFDNYY